LFADAYGGGTATAISRSRQRDVKQPYTMSGPLGQTLKITPLGVDGFVPDNSSGLGPGTRAGSGLHRSAC